MDDTISRAETIEAMEHAKEQYFDRRVIIGKMQDIVNNLPSAQPEIIACGKGELVQDGSKLVQGCIDRQAAIDVIRKCRFVVDAIEKIKGLPSAQPERKCVNCGRTVNNGGWYADGRTRCPIEEHYALPKDGYCHLWEKRNVTDDDYPERREE